jgi:hypothetical protein
MSRVLRLRFYDDHDGTGELTARVMVDEFSGESSAYFGVQEIEDFAKRISSYPIASDARFSIAGGFGSLEKEQGLEQEHLEISVYPIDQRGHIGVQVRMASRAWASTRAESQQVVRVEPLTTYAPLCRFSESLLGLVHGKIDEVVLEGEGQP